MRQNEPQDNGMTSSGSSSNKIAKYDAVLVGLITGVSSAVLAEHARDLSNRTLEPVVQYVCVAAEAEMSVLRRHWIAGHAPTVDVIAQNPECVGCAIAGDIIRSAAQHLDAGFTTIDAVLPPGTDAVHMSQRINEQTGLVTSHLRVVLDAATIHDDVHCGDDLRSTDMISWHGDQRWVAHATIGLVTAADQVILAAPNGDGATAIALVSHLNPAAGIHTQLADVPTHVTFNATDLAARRDGVTRPYTPPRAQAGYESSVIADHRPFHPQRLLQAVTEIAEHVVRVEGQLWLATQPGQVFRLHVSAGLASLDPRAEWLSNEIWEAPSESRRATADWDSLPIWGDRNSQLTVTTSSYADTDMHRAVTTRLTRALATTDELAEGPDLWRTWDDPFRP